MKVVKTKYKLILIEPDKKEKILWRGTKKECEKKKLEYSFSHNKEWIKIEEEFETKEMEKGFKGILKFLAICGLTYLCWVSGKKIYITD